MGLYPARDVGSVLNEVVGTPPTATAGSVNGTGFDRALNDNPLSCVLLASSGAATGGPSPQTFDAKIQDSADNSAFADYTDPQTGAVAAVTQQVADDGSEGLSVDLSAARRYVRVVSAIVLTGGASPTWPTSAHMIMGGLEKTS